MSERGEAHVRARERLRRRCTTAVSRLTCLSSEGTGGLDARLTSRARGENRRRSALPAPVLNASTFTTGLANARYARREAESTVSVTASAEERTSPTLSISVAAWSTTTRASRTSGTVSRLSSWTVSRRSWTRRVSTITATRVTKAAAPETAAAASAAVLSADMARNATRTSGRDPGIAGTTTR